MTDEELLRCMTGKQLRAEIHRLRRLLTFMTHERDFYLAQTVVDDMSESQKCMTPDTK